jgi:aspartyl/asparaginyl beta-hydroxylase (cupin superfamily)
MLSQYITIVFFVLIIVIFFISTFSLSKISSCENYDNEQQLKIKNDILKYNLELVDKFFKKEIQFNTLNKPNKNIEKNQTFYETHIFPELSNIKYNVIKDELTNHLNKSINIWTDWIEYDLWKNKTKNSKSSWKIIPLLAFGKWSPKNTNMFPKTTEQLQNIKGLVSAGFSKLGPNTTLKLHKGWGNLSNNVLRCHLGLIVPKNKCKVFVMGNSNDEMIQKEGKWIIFDDSLYHSASNDDEYNERIILLLDIQRPEGIEKGNSDINDSDELNKFIDEFNKNL